MFFGLISVLDLMRQIIPLASLHHAASWIGVLAAGGVYVLE